MFKLKPLKPVLLAIGFKLFYSLEAIARGTLKRIYALKGIAVGNFRTPRVLGNIALVLFLMTSIASAYLLVAKPAVANATTSSYLNFQARLESSTGAIVPDGNYNVEFKLYNSSTVTGTPDQGACTHNGGTADVNCLWVETRTGVNQVRVANGYLTVNLGSVNAFGSINWDQQLYLTMRIGGIGAPSWDAEMSPRITLTAVPYAFQAQSATQLQVTQGSSTGALQFSLSTAGNQQFIIPDQGVTGTYHVLTQEQANGNYIQNGTSPQTASFNITGTGTIGGLTVTNAGNIAFQKGSDYSSTGTQNDVNFGTGALIRLTGASTQTITGITGGTNGRILTLVNAASQAAVIADKSTANGILSLAANRITTGTSADLTLPAGASVTLIYDSGNNLWRVVGSVGVGAAFIQGGNSFGVQANLGTNDNFNLAFRTNGGTKLVLDTSGNLAFQQASTINIAQAATGTQLTIKGGDATGAGNVGGTLLLQGGAGGSGAASGTVLVQSNGSNSTSAFQVKGTSTNVLTVDTSNNAMVLGNDTTGSIPPAITVRGGTTTGSNLTGGNITFDASNGTGAAGSGDFIFRTAAGSGTVTQDAVSKSNNAGSTGFTTPMSWSHTVANQSNRILIVGLVTVGNVTWSGVTWNGTQSFTHLGSTLTCPTVDFAFGCHVDVWYLLAPAIGTHSIAASSSTNANSSGGAVSYYNVDQTTPFGTVATATGSTATNQNISDSVTTTSTDQVVLGVLGTNNTSTNGSGTPLWNDNFVFFSLGATKPGTGGNVSVDFNVNNGDWGIIGVPINPAANSIADTLQDRFHIAASGNVGINTASPQYTLDVTGTGNFTTSVYAPLFDVASAGALSIGTSNATSINVGGTATTGITVGTAAVNKTISIGATGTTANTTTVNIANTTGNATQIVNIGATNSANNTVLIQGGTGASAISLQTGAAGTIGVGTNNTANTIQIGSGSLSSGTQSIYIGTSSTGNTAGGTTNVTIGAGSTATGGTLTLQAKGTTGIGITLNTNGVVRATFDTLNNLYLGNGLTAAAPNNFVIQGTGSTTTAVAGGSITLQGGNATVGNANGGNITLSGGTGFGTGVMGSVILTTPTFQTVTNTTCSANCNITQANIDSNGAVIISASNPGLIITLNDPTLNTTRGKVVYITAGNGSNDFTLRANTGGGTGVQQDIAMRQNTTATMIWNGSDWTAAGASSSTTLQAAYDNTLTSAGGAELILSNTANHNGLTIRDSLTAPVSGNGNGTLLEVQTAQAASLFSVNSNVTDYGNNGGAENAFGTDWTATTGASVSRNTALTQYVASGIGSAAITTTGTANTGGVNTLTAALTANLRYNVSFTTKLGSGSFTDLEVDYSKDGTNTSSASCTNMSTQTVPTSVWVKVNCTFTTPTSGITSGNAILIRQTGAASRTWYVDNLSVTISADLSYATDGGVDDNTNFSTNWPSLGTSTVTRSTSTGNDTSDSAQVAAGTTANNGVKNKLAINPLATTPGTLYRISVYALLNTGSPAFSDFSVGYSPDDGGVAGSHFKACADYNTQTLSTTIWTQITCYVTTDSTAVTTPRVYFYQPTAPGSARTYFVDTFSMTLATNAVPNVQVGGGVYGGPTTLLTLDRAASAPIAANNDALLGSMYYDTTLGKLQCYEADGWGACGSSPDVIVTLSPEYTNAVLHGPGVGTMTSDFCSGALGINDGSGTPAQPTICGSTETYNFYKWTSPQPSDQTYSIFVTYQLPSTFKGFASGSTSLTGKADGTNAKVQYTIYKNSASGTSACGTAVVVTTGVSTAWINQVATGTADPSTCGFAGGDSILFKIDVTAKSNANAYVGNIGFTFSNK